MNFVVESTVISERDGISTGTITLVARAVLLDEGFEPPRIVLSLPIDARMRRASLADLQKKMADTARRSVSATAVDTWVADLR